MIRKNEWKGQSRKWPQQVTVHQWDVFELFAWIVCEWQLYEHKISKNGGFIEKDINAIRGCMCLNIVRAETVK